MLSLIALLTFAVCAGVPQAPAKPANFVKPAPADHPPATPADASPDSMGANNPDPSEDPAVTELTRKIYMQMREGRIDAMLMTPAMNEDLNPAVLAQNKALFEKLGLPTRLAVERRERSGGGTKYDYLATFPTMQIHIRIFVNNAGQVGGFSLGQ